ncbi:MAG: phosphoglucosamine mutase [Candidatus Firestonebacteria bacterium]|nr:phosphoglucosamine mutase [Candidatus Firestonebacteria bacterium]
MSSDKVTLMIGVSGVRGIVGETLTPELITRLGVAFGTYMNSGRIVVGRDTRVSGSMIKHSILAGLISTGCEVIDLDIVTTPSCSLMVRELKAAGAIIITGSHNPIEWNALKFLKSNGVFLNEDEGKQLLNIYYQGAFKKVRWDGLHIVTEDHTSAEKHVKNILANINLPQIRKKKYKVALDSCNGAGSIITPLFLKELGCEVETIYCEPNGVFPHNPEPIFINLQELCKKVKTSRANIGFAQDPDADRVAIVDANGHYLGEEYSVALASSYILKKNRGGTVVVNMSTSKMMDDIAKKYNSTLIRTKVGEVHVAERMIAEKAVIGGEGNGGVMWPKVHPVRDSLVGIALTLQNMAESGKTIKQLADELPKYYIVKEKIACPQKDSFGIMEKVKKLYEKEKVETVDGITITKNGIRISIRPSNTEPIFRIFAESNSHKKSLKVALEIKKVIAGLLKRIV